VAKTYRTLQHWEHWLARFLGAHVLQAEQAALARIYSEFHGKHTVLMGVPAQHVLLKSHLILNPVIISPLINKQTHIQAIESDFYDLPIIPGSVDLVILPHTLDFIENPHKLLLEACKVVKPEGDIIILGFNPFSFWGLMKKLSKHKNSPWNANFIPMSKVIKWLKLADFEIIKKELLFFRPPLSKENIFNKLQFLEWIGRKCFMPWGGIYIVKAKAKVIPLTPIKLLWKQKLSPLSVTLPGPTMRDRQ
jgi:SAM-dependent methyltransferase